MKTILNLDELFLDQLSNLYSGQVMLTTYLQPLNEKINLPELQTLMQKYKIKSFEQLTSLEIIFKHLNKSPYNNRNLIMKSLLDSALHSIMQNSYSDFLDISIIKSIQQICHHKLSAYSSALIYANALNHEYISKIIYMNIFDEKKIDKELSFLAIKNLSEESHTPLFI